MTTFAERRQEADEDSYEPQLGECPSCGRMSLAVTRHLAATMESPEEDDYRCTSEDCEWET